MSLLKSDENLSVLVHPKNKCLVLTAEEIEIFVCKSYIALSIVSMLNLRESIILFYSRKKNVNRNNCVNVNVAGGGVQLSAM